MKWFNFVSLTLFFEKKLHAIIVKCLHHITLPFKTLTLRMASGLMEIWKARNSINLLLIDLISFYAPLSMLQKMSSSLPQLSVGDLAHN